jgi:predicted solute-binding protein
VTGYSEKFVAVADVAEYWYRLTVANWIWAS